MPKNKKSRKQVADLDIEVDMELVKETKGAVQYAELDEDGDLVEKLRDCLVGRLYLRKETFDGDEPPERITVSITTAE